MKRIVIFGSIIVMCCFFFLSGCTKKSSDESSVMEYTTITKETESENYAPSEKESVENTQNSAEKASDDNIQDTTKATQENSTKETEKSDAAEDIDFTAMNEESGIYHLINKIKDMGKSSANYITGFGSTTSMLITAYRVANPDSRFDASLKEVLAKSKEIYLTELAMKKLDDAYDFSLDEMNAYSNNTENKTITVISQYKESYSEDILGWLDKQYDSFSNVGKRTTYYGKDEIGREVLVMPENKLRDKGNVTLWVVCLESKTVSVDGFSKTMPVYYEISQDLQKKFSVDYNSYKKYSQTLEKQKQELDELLNQIEVKQ